MLLDWQELWNNYSDFTFITQKKQMKDKNELPTYKAIEIAREEWIDYHTVSRNRKKYIPVKFENTTAKKKTKRWYSVRYLKVSDILDELSNR